MLRLTGHRRLADALPTRRSRLIAGCAAFGAVLVLVAAVQAGRASFARSELSGDDQHRLGRSLSVLNGWCLSRRPPAGGRVRLGRAVDQLVHLAETKPRRRTDVVDSAYVTVREEVTEYARLLDGTCRRPVAGSARVRAEALDLAESREGTHAAALDGQEVRKRLSRIADTLALRRVAGPPGVETYRGRIGRKGIPALGVAVVVGHDAVEKVRRFPRHLLAHESNAWAIHPQNGVDTALVLDSTGLEGAPYTEGFPSAVHSRRVRQRRGDLRNAAEWALVGEVGH